MEFDRSWWISMIFKGLREDDLCFKACEMLEELELDQAIRLVSDTYVISDIRLVDKGLVLDFKSWLFSKGEYIEIGSLGNASACCALVFWRGVIGKWLLGLVVLTEGLILFGTLWSKGYVISFFDTFWSKG